MELTDKDKIQIARKGITEDRIQQQLDKYQTGFRYAELTHAAVINDGVRSLNENKINHYVRYYDQFRGERSIHKFVPASGAASRMFKDIYQFLEAPALDHKIVKTLLRYSSLGMAQAIEQVANNNNLPIDTDSLEGLTNIAKILVSSEGLNYGNLPKGYIIFHEYEKEVRTAFEEHLVEGALYATGTNGIVNIHFTVSAEFLDIVKELVDNIIPNYENRYVVKYNISYSVQLPSTDTIAVDLKNKPIRIDNKLVFRPGGHGALIENLQEIDAELVFIKNIDNIVPDRLKDVTVKYKKMLTGYLMAMQDKAFEYLEQLEGDHTEELLEEIAAFIQDRLGLKGKLKTREDMFAVLNRPIRVCGMVKNEGEPGGGPFWVRNIDGFESLQIVETSQIDLDDPEQKQILSDSSHFNPVDIVCSTKNYKGEKFDLSNYVDHETGFIAQKSKDGIEFKQQELPGLWNGAMAYWTTVFIEVPGITFNPVKTVSDLLRPEHVHYEER